MEVDTIKLKVSGLEDLKLILRIIKKLKELNLIEKAKLEDVDNNGNVVIKLIY